MPYDIQKLREGLTAEMKRRGLDKPKPSIVRLCCTPGCKAIATVILSSAPRCTEHAIKAHERALAEIRQKEDNALTPWCQWCGADKPDSRRAAKTCSEDCRWEMHSDYMKRKSASVV